MRISTISQFRNQQDLMSHQMTEMLRYMSQLTTGNKISASSENPVLAAQMKAQANHTEEIKQYGTNATLAKNRLERISSITRSTTNLVSDMKNLFGQIQAPDGSSNTVRTAASQQATGFLNLLLTYANTTDADGSYIFSGFSTNVQPYVLSSGNYSYQGGYTRSYIEVGDNAQAMYYENGENIFGNVLNGNGVYTVTAGASNTGSASTDPGVVTDQSAYVEDTYTLTFVTNSSGQLAYQVVGASSGQVIPTLPAAIPDDAPAYSPGSAVSFNGVSFAMGGGPAVGDTFTIAPSSTVNIFNATQDLISTLNNTDLNFGQFTQEITQLSQTFTQIFNNLLNYQTEIGSMQKNIEQQIVNNTAISLNNDMILSGLNESDTLTQSAASGLARTQMAIQSTTSCYLKLQEVLMQILKLS